MKEENKQLDGLIHQLHERAKELNCLYQIEDSLNHSEKSLEEIFKTVLEAIPPGWQFPSVCMARLTCNDRVYHLENFFETSWKIEEEIFVQDKVCGRLEVFYREQMPPADFGPFLKEEQKLLKTIAERLGHFILHQNLKKVINELEKVERHVSTSENGKWQIILEMVQKTDPILFASIVRRLLHHLCMIGSKDAEDLLKIANSGYNLEDETNADENKPMKKILLKSDNEFIKKVLEFVKANLDSNTILQKIQKYLEEEKSAGLVKTLENNDTSLAEICDAVRHYFVLKSQQYSLSESNEKGLRVSLLRRLFTDNLNFIAIAKEFVQLDDFKPIIDKIIFPPGSHGKLGGKSAGLFLASNILKEIASKQNLENISNIKVPKTWYVTSDTILYFIQYNNLEEVLEQKYKDIEEIKLEYPHIVQLFKNSRFPPDIVNSLSVCLDDFGDNPIVVRSSSLLEDQVGAAFSGKYKSLFLANQGGKKERLEALTDAIAEVYASTFHPDPLGYRMEKGLIDFHEEMGIMIQEVVGAQVGRYFLPAFAGVAFSKNEFRWSPRINREDGLIRIVPGLGTRAVDRLSDDYPILISPAKPQLKANASVDAELNYSPKKIDVLNLDQNEFQTLDLNSLLKSHIEDYPFAEKIFSKFDGVHFRNYNPFDIDHSEKNIIATFNGLIQEEKYTRLIDSVLKLLMEKMNSPIDIEFAFDGNDFHLLQCRPQSQSGELYADAIPSDLKKENLLFTARKFVSNGKVQDITHIVYVKGDAYASLPSREEMLLVGKIIGKLNKILPKRKFALIGPGRWGSRGDIKLGVSVTYSDISNTALLIEVAYKSGSYSPDLSFGTHFFQDLVEASIRYLPLYPDDKENFFDEEFLIRSKNKLGEILPGYKSFESTIFVIDVNEVRNGMLLKVLMNAELEMAVGVLTGSEEEIYSSKPHFNLLKDDEKKFEVHAEQILKSLRGSLAEWEYDINKIFLSKNIGLGKIEVGFVENKNSKKMKLWLEGWKSGMEVSLQKNKIDLKIKFYNSLDEIKKSGKYL